MRKSFWLIVAMAVVVSGPAWSQGAPAKGGDSQADAKAAAANLEMFRQDVQAKRADLLAKNITLSADEAAKFWPLYEKFQKEQNAIMDKQLQAIQQYVDNYATLDDATTLKLMNATLGRDSAMSDLRKKWLPEFQKVVPTRTAVRAIQIDRRLSLVLQVELSSRIPLVR